MKKFYVFSMFAMMLSIVVSFSSCSKDDDGVTEGLVNQTVPTQKGWSGSMENGICTYTPDYGDEDADGYYAFSFKDGKCDDAVYNMMFETEAEAKEAAKLLNNGTFEDLNAFDEEDEIYETNGEMAMAKALNQVKMIKKEQLLSVIEEVKKEIEDGKITDLVMAGCDKEGGVSTKIVAAGITSLGLAEFLNAKVKNVTFAQIDQQDLQKKLLDMFAGDHN